MISIVDYVGHKGLSAYQAAIDNGASNADIMASPLATDEVKEVAAVFQAYKQFGERSAVEYLPENLGSVNLFDTIGDPRMRIIIGTWQREPRGGAYTFNEDGTCVLIKDGLTFEGMWERTEEGIFLQLQAYNGDRRFRLVSPTQMEGGVKGIQTLSKVAH